MTKAHVAHDGRCGAAVTLAAMVVTAGDVAVGAGAIVGLGTGVHPRLTVGAGAMIGMQSAVTRQLPLYVVSMGVPARASRLNPYRLDRLGVSEDHHQPLAAVVLHGSRDTSAIPEALRGAVDAWL